MLDDEEADLLVLLIAELELLFVGLLIISLHCFLLGLFFNCWCVIFVEINIRLINPGQKSKTSQPQPQPFPEPHLMMLLLRSL